MFGIYSFKWLTLMYFVLRFFDCAVSRVFKHELLRTKREAGEDA